MARAASLDPQLRARILALRASGASFDRIAAALNRRGIASLSGVRWYGASVRLVVTRAAASGK